MKLLIASLFVTAFVVGLVWTNLGRGLFTPLGPLPVSAADVRPATAQAMPAARPMQPQTSWVPARPQVALPAMQASPAAAGTVPEPVQDPATDPALVGWGRPPAPAIDPRRFTEAHWQGLEVIPKSLQVAQALGLPPEVPGVIVDDVTLPADLQGFQAGDLITQVGRNPTPDLVAFIAATNDLRDLPNSEVRFVRNNLPQMIVLTALQNRLGTANGETPSMIPPGARMPHPYRGPCTNCHRIGTTGTLRVDQGDLITTTAPVIRAGDVRPHRDRGPCTTCHQIVP